MFNKIKLKIKYFYLRREVKKRWKHRREAEKFWDDMYFLGSTAIAIGYIIESIASASKISNK